MKEYIVNLSQNVKVTDTDHQPDGITWSA